MAKNETWGDRWLFNPSILLGVLVAAAGVVGGIDLAYGNEPVFVDTPAMVGVYGALATAFIGMGIYFKATQVK